MARSRILAFGLASAMFLAPIAANAGGPSYGDYFKHFKHFKHHHHMKAPPKPKGPSMGGGRGTPLAASWAAASIGCSTIGLMAGSIGRQMKIEEAEYIVGNCFLPFIGGELFRYLRAEMAKSRNALN
jgi:hypothetical protein